MTEDPKPDAPKMPEPDGWVTMWTAMAGGRKPVYNPGKEPPSYGAELDALLNVYPVCKADAAQAYAEALAAQRVAKERERCAAAVRAGHDSGDATGMDREVYMWNKAVAHCLRRVLMPESFTPIDQPPETGNDLDTPLTNDILRRARANQPPETGKEG